MGRVHALFQRLHWEQLRGEQRTGFNHSILKQVLLRICSKRIVWGEITVNAAWSVGPVHDWHGLTSFLPIPYVRVTRLVTTSLFHPHKDRHDPSTGNHPSHPTTE